MEENRESAEKFLSEKYGLTPEQAKDRVVNNNYKPTLSQSLLLSMDFEYKLLENTEDKIAPNYLDFIHLDTLKKIYPENVTISVE
jgi:hypothetical protein